MRSMTRMTAVVTLIAALGISPQGLAADGDDYPAKPVKMIVQYPPGGGQDIAARLLAGKFSEIFGKPFLVENRSGASGNIGTEFVARSAPDGYTLLVSGDPPITINPNLFTRLGYDPVKDFAPVSLVSTMSFFLLVTPNLPVNSVQDLINLAKTKPGELNFASSGTGSQHHLAGEMFGMRAGARLVHVPYKGFGAGVVDVMSGKVEVIFGSASAAASLVKSGKLKALAMTSSKRSEVLPQVPTLLESGLPGFELYGWVGLLSPARTPRPIIDKLRSQLTRVLQSKDVAEQFATLGMDLSPSGPEEFAERISLDTRMWARVIKDLGVKSDN